jgi:beta-barrel assembly-enhancing protease
VKRLFFSVLAVLIPAAMLCAGDETRKDTNKKNDPSEIGNRKVAGGPNFYSIEKELALGRQLSLEVEKQAKLFEDPIVNEYVNRVVQNLARHSDVTFPVTIKIIESDQPNAFTLPGGHIFIDTGLIRLTESEAELAATLAHELGHVAARHATRQATEGKIANIATIPLFVLGGPAAMIGRSAASIAMPMSFLKFSRVFETEADQLGLQYMYEAGYDPSGSLDIFERLESIEKKRPGTIAQLFNTHPMTSDRIQKTQKNIQSQLPARDEYVMNTSEYEDVRSRLLSMLNYRKMTAAPDKRPTLMKQGEHFTPERTDH